MIAKVKINGVIGEEIGLLNVIEQVEPFAAELSGIEVFINSPGGIVEDGFQIADYLRGKAKRVPVTTIALGECYSIATVIFAEGTTRMIAPTSQLMIHNAWSDMGWGNADQLRDMADELEEVDKKIRKRYTDRFGLDSSALEPLMKRDTYISPNQAIALKMANGLYEGEEITPEQAKMQPILALKNQTKIAAMNKSLLDELKALAGSLKSLVKSSVKNMVIELADENKTKLYVMTEDGELPGKVAYIADAEGNPTEELAPAGTHSLLDGRSIVVGEGGVIESVAEAQGGDKPLEDRLAALQAENTALKAELDGVKTYIDQIKPALAMLKSNGKAPAAAPRANSRTSQQSEPQKPELKERREEIRKAKEAKKSLFNRN